MIRLTFIGEGVDTSVNESSPYYRVTGGVVWTRPEAGPIATLVESGWKHRDCVWSGMRFEGPCRLILGLPRDPIGVSEPLKSVSVAGHVLSVNGLPVAVYNPAREHWYGVIAGTSWPAFRIESAHLREPAAKPTLNGDVTVAPIPPNS